MSKKREKAVAVKEPNPTAEEPKEQPVQQPEQTAEQPEQLTDVQFREKPSGLDDVPATMRTLDEEMQEQRALLSGRYRALESAERKITDEVQEAKSEIKETRDQLESLMKPIREARAGVAGLYWDVGEVAVALKENVERTLGYGHWGHYLDSNDYEHRTVDRAMWIFRGFRNKRDCDCLSLRQASALLRDEESTFDANTYKGAVKYMREARKAKLTREEADVVTALCTAIRAGEPIPAEVTQVFHNYFRYNKDRGLVCLAYLNLCINAGTEAIEVDEEEDDQEE